MNISTLINQSIKSLEKLPKSKVYKVVDFIEFPSKKHNEKKVTERN